MSLLTQALLILGEPRLPRPDKMLGATVDAARGIGNRVIHAAMTLGTDQDYAERLASETETRRARERSMLDDLEKVGMANIAAEEFLSRVGRDPVEHQVWLVHYTIDQLPEDTTVHDIWLSPERVRKLQVGLAWASGIELLNKLDKNEPVEDYVVLFQASLEGLPADVTVPELGLTDNQIDRLSVYFKGQVPPGSL